MSGIGFPTLYRNGVVPSTQSDQLRVLLINADTVHPDRLIQLFRTAGATVEQSRFDKEVNRAIQTAAFDILVLHAGDSDEMADHLYNWRSEGLKAPAIVVAETGSSTSTASVSGVVATISESIEPSELRSRLNALRLFCRGETHVLELFDLRIDLLLRTVERAGRSIMLTPREFGVLEYLATQRGKVVSRRSILDQVFGITDFHSSNVVDVYIRTLRQKIDRDHGIKLIETRRGYGYLLRSDGLIESTQPTKAREGNPQ
jgi:DNA-binding response OmpR family regulator